MAGENSWNISFKEDDIPGAKLGKKVDKKTKIEAVLWLICRGCRNLSGFIHGELIQK